VDVFQASESLFPGAIAPECRAPESWHSQVSLSDGSIYLRWGELFEFLVSADGRSIGCHPLRAASAEALHTFLFGQVLSFALVKQGFEPLHATTVVAGGAAVGFLGFSGDGKSTMAATFLTAGYRLLTDDLLIIRPSESGYQAYPGPPRIKLFPETAAMLLGQAVQGSPMNGLMDGFGRKMIFPLHSGQHCGRPVPLGALYLLARRKGTSAGHRIRIRALSGRHPYLALSQHCFNRRIQDRERLRRQFLAGSELASKVPIKMLSYPGNMSDLPAVREAVLADLSH
jgi:hypothetical protein